MARKSGQVGRSKKSSKPMRAVSRAVAAPTVTSVAEPEASEQGVLPEAAPSTNSTRAASRKGRPYQHRKATPTARMLAARTFSISKAQEYAFIREDLRRLLITAGILIVVMIALLFAIDR
ncbi:MAG: hypothetical protein M3457_20480 [Chloroflexota bacterium]|nr:hypothetical protein [Chloroflexota bacterium]